MSPPLHTKACDLFGVQYPIVQTGRGWVSGPTLTATPLLGGGDRADSPLPRRPCVARSLS